MLAGGGDTSCTSSWSGTRCCGAGPCNAGDEIAGGGCEVGLLVRSPMTAHCSWFPWIETRREQGLCFVGDDEGTHALRARARHGGGARVLVGWIGS